MLPNSCQNEKGNLQILFRSLVAATVSSFLSGCFQQAAPERIPTADTLESCLSDNASVQFAHLTADGGTLAAFPADLAKCPALWKLSLRGQTALAPLPDSLADLKGLRWLDLSEMGLTGLPEGIASLPLQRLYLSDNHLETLPACVAKLSGLDYLNLDRNGLTALPPEVSAWTNVRWLRLNGNHLASLPAEAASWTALQRLYLRENAFQALPESITALPALEQLDLGRNGSLAAIPDSIGNLASLTRLDLDYTAVETLPDSIGKLTKLNTLVLYGCPMATNEIERVRALLPAGCRIEF